MVLENFVSDIFNVDKTKLVDSFKMYRKIFVMDTFLNSKKELTFDNKVPWVFNLSAHERAPF